MKCREVRKLLVAYLDNEVTPSERTLIQAHMAGCETCQEKLAALSALQGRIGQFLQVRAAQVAPSPQAWSCLQARLTGEARLSWFQLPALVVRRTRQAFRPREGMVLKREFVLALVVALVIIVGSVAFVSPIRAQVGKVIAQWSRFEVPGGRIIIRMLSPGVDFAPVQPTYLPAHLVCTLEDEGRDKMGVFQQAYAGKDWFVYIAQTRLSTERALPTGMEMNVNGQPGVLNTGLQGRLELTSRFEFREENGCSSVYIYTDAKQLTWYVDDIKIEMLSNLSEEEMLKIAQSMTPREGDAQ